MVQRRIPRSRSAGPPRLNDEPTVAGIGLFLLSVVAACSTGGIYEVTAQSGKTYVGQSKDIPTRLGQHVDSGKVSGEAAAGAKTTQVEGGKTAREVAEQKKINELGGVQNLENKRNPVGKAREHLLNEEKKP